MIFKDIQPTDESPKKIQFVDMLIQKKIFNDAIFDDVMMYAEVVLDTPVQMFYRKLWVDVYLRRNPCTTVLDHNKTIIEMSLSECIQYLQEITPPKLRDVLNKDMTSVQNIYEMMRDFLMKMDDPNHPYYLTKFYEVFHMNLFQNAWTPNYKKIAFLRSVAKTDITCLVDASTVSINAIINGEVLPYQSEWLQLTFHSDDEDSMEELFRYMNTCDIHITGVQCNDIGLFVSGCTSRITPYLIDLIRDTYSKII